MEEGAEQGARERAPGTRFSDEFFFRFLFFLSVFQLIAFIALSLYNKARVSEVI